MDILEANIPQAIPRAIEEPPSATFGERLRNQARIARFDYGIPSQKLIIDNKVPSKSPPPCSSASLEDVLQQLSGIRDEVLSTGASGPRDGLQLHLDLQLEKVYMLHQNPQVFENSEVRSTFLRKAKKLLLGIRKLADFHIATNAQILKFETTDDELRRGVQFVPPRGPTTVPWNAWCMNDAPFPRKEILQLSIQQGVPVQISSQYLPRGGVFILMRWLQEAKQLVNSMLEGVEDEGRAAIIRAQRAEINTVYFYAKRQSAEQHIHMQLTEVPGLVDLLPAHAVSVPEGLTSLAAMASQLSDNPTFANGPIIMGLRLYNSLTLSGMRTA